MVNAGLMEATNHGLLVIADTTLDNTAGILGGIKLWEVTASPVVAPARTPAARRPAAAKKAVAAAAPPAPS